MGNGIYVTDEPSQSLAYSYPAINAAWKSTRFLGFRVLLGYELADASAREAGGVIAVTNPATLMLRYVFLLQKTLLRHWQSLWCLRWLALATLSDQAEDTPLNQHPRYLFVKAASI